MPNVSFRVASSCAGLVRHGHCSGGSWLDSNRSGKRMITAPAGHNYTVHSNMRTLRVLCASDLSRRRVADRSSQTHVQDSNQSTLFAGFGQDCVSLPAAIADHLDKSALCPSRAFVGDSGPGLGDKSGAPPTLKAWLVAGGTGRRQTRRR